MLLRQWLYPLPLGIGQFYNLTTFSLAEAPGVSGRIGPVFMQYFQILKILIFFNKKFFENNLGLNIFKV